MSRRPLTHPISHRSPSFAILLLLAVATHASASDASSPLHADAVAWEGEGDLALSTGTLLVRSGGSPVILDLAARAIRETHIDHGEWVAAEDSPTRFGEEPVVDEAHYLDARLIADRTGQQSTLLVQALSSRFSVESHVAGGAHRAQTIDEEVLEESHVIGPDGIGSDWDWYYAYTAKDTLAVQGSGPATHTVTGDFLLYLWDVDYIASDADGQEADRRTGHHRDQAAPTPAPLLERRHDAHAVLHIQDGRLDLRYDGGITGWYADVITAALPGDALLEGAQGRVASREGPYAIAPGDALVSGGHFTLAFQDDQRLAVEPAGPVLRVQGATIRSLEPAWWATPLGLGLTVTLAAMLVAATWSAPNLLARNATGDWRQRRSQAFLRLARRAQSHRRADLAAWLAGRAIRWDPARPEPYGVRALVRSDQGRFDAALEDHKLSHWCRRNADPEHLDTAGAINAFEAACAATNAGRLPEALHWLRLAVGADPGLRAEAAAEPDLGPISQDPRFQALVSGVMDVGWNRA
ncbi:MAG: TPR end-of-group domain-containing protein [Thermoplasmatota archaeon]